ncbi:MAG: AzlD domain-containing protein [Proteobacteria bacterium]|nr:AzlD domain-containing protein [Pseudomonadota bacterium]
MNEIGLWYLLFLAIAATYVWRGLGVVISGRIDPEGEAFKIVSCVAYALLAGLISRMIVLPTGALAETPTFDRVFSVIVGIGVFFLFKRNVLLGTFGGVAVFFVLSVMRAGS